MSGAALDQVETQTTAEIKRRLLLGECIVCRTTACGGECIPQDGVVDLFAGPGGWDVAAQWLDLPVVGVELEPNAVATRHAAGHRTIHGSVTAIPLHLFAVRGVRGLIASPPCQTFSQAGKGSGRRQLDLLAAAIRRLGAGEWPQEEIDGTHDPRTALVLEPLRWALALQPTWLAFEQVPGVLPVWEVMAEVLREHGWFVTTGVVQAEQYGVPQTRKRAVLLGHRERPVTLPTPTHSRYHVRTPEKMDRGVQRWVSMAEALQWGMTDRPYPTIATGTAAGGTDPQALGGSGARACVQREIDAGRWIVRTSLGKPRADVPNGHHALDPAVRPAHTVTAMFNWTVEEGDFAQDRAAWNERYVPDFVDQSGTPVDTDWPEKRPSTTVATRDLVQNPGATANRHNGSTKSRNDGVRVTVEQAAVLQSFPASYPWQGTKSKQYEQVGNAVPPVLALALLCEVAT